MAKKKRKKRKKRSYAAGSAFHPFEKLRDSFRYKRSLYVITGIIMFAVLVVAAAVLYVADNYTVKNIEVDGNTHYSKDEIADMVMTDKLCHNSMFLSMKYMNKSIEDIPFIEKIDVDIVSKDTVKINVFEKAVAGYIAYLGRYIYFDREGIVVECSSETTEDVPQVMGLNFDHITMHEKLPIDEDHQLIFGEILDITQLLNKYKLHADKIFFDSDFNVYLYFGGVEVSIGKNDYIDEKIQQLQYQLPRLEGQTGILNLKDLNEDTKLFTFTPKN